MNTYPTRTFDVIKAILRHKWFVLVAAWKLDISLFRLLFHDITLFFPGHFKALRKHVRSSQHQSYDALKENVLISNIDHEYRYHINRLSHHWQYWVLLDDEGKLSAQYIPEDDAEEMLADWMAYAREETGEWDPYAYIDAHKEHMIIHPDTWRYIHTKLLSYGYISKHSLRQPLQTEEQCGVVDALSINIDATDQCVECDTSCCYHCSSIYPNIIIRQRKE